MTIFLDIAAFYAKYLNRSQIEESVLATLDHQQISSDSDLTVIIDHDARIQEINREFLGIDAPTDVLAFPAGHQDPDTKHVYLGDVIISYPQANKQALKAGHSLSAEINLLVVHGVLHLLGHDHNQSEGRAIMWSAQNDILTNLGNEINFPELSSYSDV
jgi:probable rRNA maturation factor